MLTACWAALGASRGFFADGEEVRDAQRVRMEQSRVLLTATDSRIGSESWAKGSIAPLPATRCLGSPEMAHNMLIG